MDNKLIIRKHNEVFVKLQAEKSTLRSIWEEFSYFVPNYKFHPKVKLGIWDGKIRLLNLRNNLFYKGIAYKLYNYCVDNNIKLEIEPNLFVYDKEITEEIVEDFIETLNIPEEIELRDYQIQTIKHCIEHKRALFLSPTASGKSFMIYVLTRYFNQKTLIIVDSINLLNQMYSDFQEYGFDSESNIHRISAGTEKESNKQILISTWQSACKQPKEWFDQFGLVIGDEAHKYKANELKKIMENLVDCELRFGFTGSLDGSISSQMMLEGLFGKYKKIVTTKELIEMEYLSDAKIKMCFLKYPENIRKSFGKIDYQTELNYIYSSKERLNFIINLTKQLQGTTLILFSRIDSLGKVLHQEIEKQIKDKTIYYVDGGVIGEERESIRKKVINSDNSIILGSTVFVTGVNIPNIDNIILASPTKSQIRVLQSLGRGLRKTKNKTHCKIFDIVDDLSWKKRKNITLKHGLHRIEIYSKENLDVKLVNKDL